MKVTIESIHVPVRRREALGDLAGLAKSLEKYGLMHPIVLDDQGVLVAGMRRMEAAKRLGWTEIEACVHGELTAEERDRLELEENVKRKDLTSAEIAKNMKALAKKIGQELQTQTQETCSPVTGEQVNPPHRPKGSKKRDSQQAVADAMGIPQQTLSKNLAYANAIERYPDLERLGIPQDKAIIMAKTLDALPEDAREQKRHALREGQRNILSDLADLPPMPEHEPTPDYQKQWSAGLAHLRRGIRELSDPETLQGMRVRWSPEKARRQQQALQHEIEQLQAMCLQIEEGIQDAEISPSDA